MEKLSELIRKGCKMSAPTEKGWHDVGPDGKLRTCALMAAAEAAGLVKDNGSGGVECRSDGKYWDNRTGAYIHGITAPKEWVVLNEMEKCPFCELTDQLIEVIPHLHDVHKQSREATAEWVEVIENKHQRILDTEHGVVEVGTKSSLPEESVAPCDSIKESVVPA